MFFQHGTRATRINSCSSIPNMKFHRSQTNLKGITDMWTSMNITSRLDAAEGAIAKIGGLVEDVIKELRNFPQTM